MNLTSVLADAGGPTRILVRALALGGTAMVIGAVAFWWVVMRSTTSARFVTADAERQVATIGMFAAAVLAIAAPWRILGQADAFMSPGDPLLPIVVTVLQTTWGRAASVQVAASIVALLGLWSARNLALRGWAVALAASVMLAATPAWMGHAAATESRPAIAIAADVLHVAAAGSWAGAVVVLALLLRHLRRQATGGVLAAELITRFRTLALAGAGTLLATGVVSALFRLNSPSDLVRSAYGVMLAIKLALVATAAMLGRRHSQTAAERARAGGAGAIARSIGAEALLLLAVVAISALLSASPPPGD